MYQIEGKTILITGGSGGIGFALAKECAKEGAKHIILVARDKTKLSSAKLVLENLGVEEVSIFSYDLSNVDDRRKFYQAIKRKKITVDILCNNAGFGKMIDFASGDSKLFQNMIDLNVKTVVDLTHHFLQDMLKRESGGIINVASVAGFQSLPFFNIYAASKAFVLSFTEALYGEYTENGIRIMALCPAETNTNRMKRAGAKVLSSEKFDTPENVAKKGIKAFKKGRMTLIPNWKSYLFHGVLVRFFPRKLLVKLIAKRYHYYKIFGIKK